MAKLSNEQIEQKKQLLAEKMKEMKAIYDELAEAGAIEITDDDLDQVAGGFLPCGPDKYYEWLKKHQSDFV